MHVGWGYRPNWSGGLLVYVEDIMAAQAALGHDVSYFCSGHYNFKKTTYLRRWKDNQVSFCELVNPPVVPSSNLDPQFEISEAETERHFGNALSEFHPDIVHIHSFIGLTASLVDVARDSGAAVVLTLHEYHPVCPALFLFDYRKRVCTDYEEGRGCIQCLQSLPPPGSVRRRNQLRTLVNGNGLVKILTPLASLGVRMASHFRQAQSSESRPNPNGAAKCYVLRRTEFVQRLNRTDLILCNSDRLASIFAYYGVNSEKLLTLYYSLSSFDRLQPKQRQGVRLPLTFCYLNSVDDSKGARVAVEAFAGIDRDKARLVVHGYGRPEYIRELKKIAGRADVSFYGRYRHESLPRILENVDVGIVPSVREEPYGIVGVEFLCAGIPVIGSRRGGIPEYVEGSVNGFLFDPEDVNDLRAKINRFIDDPGLRQRLSRNIRRPERFSEHIDRLNKLYLQAIARRHESVLEAQHV